MWIIEEFRDKMYQASFIQENPFHFLNTKWVDVEELKRFLAIQTPDSIDNNLTPFGRVDNDSVLTRIKSEPDTDATDATQLVKQEQNNVIQIGGSIGAGIRTRTIFEDGIETIELLSSDSEHEEEEHPEWEASSQTMVGSGWAPDFADSDMDDAGSILSDNPMDTSDIKMSSEPEIERALTVWLDSDVESAVSRKARRLNRQLVVEELEEVTGLPSYWPVLRVKTGYILDLSDEQYNIKDEHDNLLPVASAK
ncbi:hypothetical protein DXG01_005183 [Tephrocybe rancida]|nr:hypothetical protein DXG01_005183 [Tephrocybe rancida]